MKGYLESQKTASPKLGNPAHFEFATAADFWEWWIPTWRSYVIELEAAQAALRARLERYEFAEIVIQSARDIERLQASMQDHIEAGVLALPTGRNSLN